MLKRKYLLLVLVLGAVLAACEQPGGLALDPNNGGNNNENNGNNNGEKNDNNNDENNSENNDENNGESNDESNDGDYGSNNDSEFPEGWEDWEEETEDPPEVIGIVIAELPNKTIYPNNFTSFDWEGLVVYRVWDNGMTDPTTDYAIDTSDVMRIEGETTNSPVYVNKGTYQQTFMVIVDKSNRELKSVTLNGSLPTTSALGAPLDLSKITVTASYEEDGVSSTESIPGSSCKVSGYDMRKRGAQTIAVKVNGVTVAENHQVTVKVPENATIEIPPPTKGQYKPGQITGFRPAYLKGERYDPATDAGLAIRVTANGQTIPLTFANGGLTMADLAAANTAFDGAGRFTTKGTNTIRFKLDDKDASYDVFVMDSPGTQPRVYFDYGYRQTAADENGKGLFGDGKYYVKAGSKLVLAPVLFLIGYTADYTPDTVSYAWSVSGGSYDTTEPHYGETFTFKPTASSTPTTYTVTVNVMGRNVITGSADTKSASTEVVYGIEPKTSSITFNQPLKDFAPGQFTERGTGYGWSLGAVLGYEVWNAGATVSTAKITGNGFETWNEPGVVWVQADDNGNGLPDETWYEIPGGDDTGTYKDNVTRRYALTYYRDQFAETTPNQYDQIIRTIYWVAQRGRIGTLGGGWPSDNPKGISKVSGDWITYTGTLLRDSKGEKLNLGQTNLAPISGYADVMSGGSQTLTFSASSAIRADGTSAGLNSFRFIKVQTAYFEYGDVFGERSTEIVSATGLSDQSGGFPNPLGNRGKGGV